MNARAPRRASARTRSPISSKTLRLPRATASLASSTASNGVCSRPMNRPSRDSASKQPAPQQPAPEGPQRVQQRPTRRAGRCRRSSVSSPRIVAPGLPRGPGRERAPVRALPAAPRHLGGEQRVRVGDLEVAQDGDCGSRRSAARPPGDHYAVRVPITAPERLAGERDRLEVVDVRHRERDAVQAGVEVLLDLLGDLVRVADERLRPRAVRVGRAARPPARASRPPPRASARCTPSPMRVLVISRRVAADVLAVALEHAEQVLDALDVAEQVRAVGVLGHEAQRLALAAAADQDRDVAADRLRVVERAVDAVVLALERRHVLA